MYARTKWNPEELDDSLYNLMLRSYGNGKTFSLFFLLLVTDFAF